MDVCLILNWKINSKKIWRNYSLQKYEKRIEKKNNKMAETRKESQTTVFAEEKQTSFAKENQTGINA